MKIKMFFNLLAVCQYIFVKYLNQLNLMHKTLKQENQ